MRAEMPSQFDFDLDHIDQVTTRARGFKESFARSRPSRVRDSMYGGR